MPTREHWDELFKGTYQVFGNLPYYLSSSLLEQLLEHEHRWERAAFLLQKEVVARLVAKPGSKAYSALTILSDFHAKLEKGPIVGRHSFYPVPKVDSQFLHLIRRDAPPVNVPNRQIFWQLVRGCVCPSAENFAEQPAGTLSGVRPKQIAGPARTVRYRLPTQG